MNTNVEIAASILPDVDFDVSEDESPIGYHIDGTKCFARIRECPKGGTVTRDGSTGYLDLSNPENLKAFRWYMSSLTPAPMPTRLEDGRPQAALKWFDDHLAGRTFKLDIPGVGHRELRIKEGHLFRLVCETPSRNGVRKGFVAKAKDAVDARRLIRRGEVLASECAGWNESRAKSLPLIPLVFEDSDAILRERDRPGFVTFVKKFINKSGGVNTVVVRLNEDGETVGPMSAHVKGLTDSWLKKQDLTDISAHKVLRTSRANSTPDKEVAEAKCVEDSSPATTCILPNSAEGVNPVDKERSTLDARAFSTYLAGN